MVKVGGWESRINMHLRGVRGRGRRIRMQVSGRDVEGLGEEDHAAGEWQGWWRVEIFCIFISGSTSWHKCS